MNNNRLFTICELLRKTFQFSDESVKNVVFMLDKELIKVNEFTIANYYIENNKLEPFMYDTGEFNMKLISFTQLSLLLKVISVYFNVIINREIV